MPMYVHITNAMASQETKVSSHFDFVMEACYQVPLVYFTALLRQNEIFRNVLKLVILMSI